MSARVSAARETIVALIRVELAGLPPRETLEVVNEVADYLEGHAKDAADDVEHDRRQEGMSHGWY